MPINCNVLAKYLVMVSQVIAWCTVSVMLLRKGMNQVNAVAQQSSPLPLQPYSNDSNAYEPAASAVHEDARDYDSATIGVSVTATDTGHHYETPPKSFDNGGPAVVAGIVMITIAVIMLIISPTIMLLKIIEKRKKRILDAELESPPKYEDVVESAPRYSSLFVFNDGEMALLSEDERKEKDNIKIQLV